MAKDNKLPRLSRLTAILLKLQSRPLVRIKDLAAHFNISTRTIYRDLIALQEAGVPIVEEEGKGYRLLSGYNIPPIMFSESEANALIIAEKIIGKTKDQSLIHEFNKVTDKIRSVLKSNEKSKADFLAERIIIGKNWNYNRTSAYMDQIQKALTNFHILKIEYQREDKSKSNRMVEPFAIYHNTSEQWVLIAWCQMRKSFRNFRVDRILDLQMLSEQFEPHKMNLDEYVAIQRERHFNKSVT